VHHGVTGIHFTEQSWESLADAMLRLSDRSFDPLVIREHAQQFSRKRFEIGMRELVQSHV